ncbi:MAG: hypothetical protein J6Y28_06635 [Acholeplasmatales bacterium]|nr:hypothetical protein [Acholeplasmatales bacterium]
MIDIHTHILNGVDNGCKDYNDAGKVVLKAKSQDVTAMFVTPHQTAYAGFDADSLKQKFNKFNEIFQKHGVDLYLGAEIEYSKDVLVKVFYKKLLSMNNTKFVLIDFNSSQEEYDLLSVIKDYKAHGFKIIIAHAECLNLKESEYLRIKNAGAYIQVDAEDIFNKKYKKIIDYLFEERLVDFVASNIHSSKGNYIMDKALKDVTKRTTKDYADLIFNRNAKNLLILGK